MAAWAVLVVRDPWGNGAMQPGAEALAQETAPA